MTKAMTFDSINVGDAMPTFTSDPVTRTHIVRYAGASGDFNPLHHDETFVKLFGMPRIISHGMLIMGITGRAVTDWIDDKHLRKFGVRFSGMTEPMDLDDPNSRARATIVVTGKVVEKFEEAGEKRIRCEIQAADALGAVKITGSFVAALP
ncbi:MAG: dehydratase [Deltaproteobacteria bacterium HGW-Deltaproteobacteria-19]|jgi:acyl dehydratase|nr:MAG: dehydratase [Deltaproteobacteria bacterium HGW-Deltaproteobacteria-19]